MDEFTAFSSKAVQETINSAMVKGTWVTLHYQETLCSISNLVRNKVVPPEILELGNLMTPFDENFRLIFVSSKLEYPKSMLENCILIGIEEEKLLMEKELTKFKRVRGVNKKDPARMQMENEFVEACFEGNLDKVKEMLKTPWVNANTKDLNLNTCLMQAALKGHLNVCKILLYHSNGQDIQENIEETTEMHVPKEPNLKKLDVNSVNYDGKTALHKAAYNGNSAVIKLLLLYGADPEIVDSSGNKPMDYINNQEAKYIMKKWKPEWAQRSKPLKCTKEFENPDKIDIKELSRKMKKKLQEFLIEKARNGEYSKIYSFVSKGKATVETKNSDGQSLLSIAVVYGHFDCVYRMLKELSPNVNSRDSKGWTPLMNAAFNGYLKIAKLLISHDADINLKNDQNMKALDLAKGEELKKYFIQETRNAHIFDFEQILELSMVNSSSKNRIYIPNPYKIEHEEEEGNRSLFENLKKANKQIHQNSKPKPALMRSQDSHLFKRKSRVFSNKSPSSNRRVHKAIQNQRHINLKSRSKLLNSKSKKKRKCFSPDITAKNGHFLLLDHL
ncbi:unnamed protein product [Moneuplotes crassus]|uniref:Uncharacterized protein n=1 Tax=Euplotes crassus TaxID=5936 RepID=A0AAD2DB24_EUPCR|nr:unnamed protein product [Moneuplotes crassus]